MIAEYSVNIQLIILSLGIFSSRDQDIPMDIHIVLSLGIPMKPTGETPKPGQVFNPSVPRVLFAPCCAPWRSASARWRMWIS